MFVRLTAEQIQRAWGLIKESIHESRPPMYVEEPEFYEYIQEALLKGDMDCWVAAKQYSENPSDLEIIAFCVTELLEDYYNKCKNLLIFSLKGVDKLGPDLWQEGMQGLEAFARVNNCRYIIAYTDHPGIVRMAQQQGGTVRQYIQLEVH